MPIYLKQTVCYSSRPNDKEKEDMKICGKFRGTTLISHFFEKDYGQ